MAEESLEAKAARLKTELDATNQQIEDNKKAGAATGDEKSEDIKKKAPQAPVSARM